MKKLVLSIALISCGQIFALKQTGLKTVFLPVKEIRLVSEVTNYDAKDIKARIIVDGQIDAAKKGHREGLRRLIDAVKDRDARETIDLHLPKALKGDNNCKLVVTHLIAYHVQGNEKVLRELYHTKK